MMNESGEHGRPQRRSDGEQTHAAILDQAIRLASVEGLSNLTIGRLAGAAGISKSGLYAHFGSKERLQIETLAAAREVFTREVILPGIDNPAGIEQLRALCLSYLSYVERRVFPGGCFFCAIINEHNARPGLIREEIANDNKEWLGLLRANVIEAQAQGEIAAGFDPDQLVFELEAAMELANCLYTLHRDPVAIERARVAIHAALQRSSR